mgnify:CR=1 FL=1
MNFYHVKPALIDLIAAFLKSSLTLLISSKLISKGVGVSAFTAIALGPIVCHFFHSHHLFQLV